MGRRSLWQKQKRSRLLLSHPFRKEREKDGAPSALRSHWKRAKDTLHTSRAAPFQNKVMNETADNFQNSRKARILVDAGLPAVPA
jgi:adenine specific DNA methylase Mod